MKEDTFTDLNHRKCVCVHQGNFLGKVFLVSCNVDVVFDGIFEAEVSYTRLVSCNVDVV